MPRTSPRATGAVLFVAALLCGYGLARPRAQAQPFLPIGDVRPGMTGVGRTVFAGDTIEEFRVTLGGYQYGFPAGLVDAGETVAATCNRELQEETGLSLQRVLRQSPPVYSSSGMTDEAVSMVFVECDGRPSNAANESSEDITTVFVDPPEAEILCSATDHRMDVKTWIVLSAFARFGTI